MGEQWVTHGPMAGFAVTTARCWVMRKSGKHFFFFTIFWFCLCNGKTNCFDYIVSTFSWRSPDRIVLYSSDLVLSAFWNYWSHWRFWTAGMIFFLPIQFNWFDGQIRYTVAVIYKTVLLLVRNKALDETTGYKVTGAVIYSFPNLSVDRRRWYL